VPGYTYQNQSNIAALQAVIQSRDFLKLVFLALYRTSAFQFRDFLYAGRRSQHRSRD
jgi:hypothetical protein